MKQVKVKIETTVETMLGDKPVNELLKDIADLCHERLEYSTSKQEAMCFSYIPFVEAEAFYIVPA